MRNRRTRVVTTLILAAAGVSALAYAEEPFSLSSPAFKDGTMLARKNAGDDKTNPNCVGENLSPPLKWKNAPADTKSFAILFVDPEGRNGLGVVHWVAYGIPASITGFAEGEVSKASDKYVGGKGTRGKSAYSGPVRPRIRARITIRSRWLRRTSTRRRCRPASLGMSFSRSSTAM